MTPHAQTPGAPHRRLRNAERHCRLALAGLVLSLCCLVIAGASVFTPLFPGAPFLAIPVLAAVLASTLAAHRAEAALRAARRPSRLRLRSAPPASRETRRAA